jgi:hypothetical protein
MFQSFHSAPHIFHHQVMVSFPLLTLIEPRSKKPVKYQVLLSFYLTFTRFKFTSTGIFEAVLERYGFENLPRTVRSYQYT